MWARAKHAGSDASDEAAGNEALAMRAKIVSQAGNDVTLSRGKSCEPGVSDFFGRFGPPFEALLARQDVKFGLS